MSRYDYTCLSSQDFEELTRDLLQAEWDVALEAFKAGRDLGIDLRYSPLNGSNTIIQCKHFIKSGFKRLLAHLQHSELPKIQRLRPTRYVVVTSVELSPPEKSAIRSSLHPFILTDSDVFGADDLDGLLSRHSDIERANFKLWLTSTSVIERVLHNAEVCHTDFEVARIRRKLPLFVQGQAFPRALELLEQSRVVVISGPPGIGKTTLAEMLLYSHLEKGYEPVVIQGDVAEGKKFFRNEARRVFYFDDFLGQSFLGDRAEYFGRNQDAAIADFIEMVRHSVQSRFILTTREHILQRALILSERLVRGRLLDHQCILELRDYTHAHRARMLYNHLYFSDLPQAYKDAILEGDFFLTIVDHEHFNPRLIEWLSTNLRQRDVLASGYREYIDQLLHSPHQIWSYAFRNQLSGGARNVLLSFYTLGEYADVVDIEPVFHSLHRYRAGKYNQPITSEDFRDALKELDGAFLVYSSGQARYVNPSIREFVGSLVADDPSTAEDLLLSSIRFKQGVALWKLSKSQPDSRLATFLAEQASTLIQSLSRLLYGPSTRWITTGFGQRRGYSIDIGRESKIGFLLEVAESQRSRELCIVAAEASSRLIGYWNGHVPNFRGLRQLLQEIAARSWSYANGGWQIYRSLVDGALKHLVFARADDWLELIGLSKEAVGWTPADQAALDSALEEYRASGIQDERRECTTVDEMEELIAFLTELGEKTGKDFSGTMQSLQDELAEREEDSPRLSGSKGAPAKTSRPAPEIATDDDLRQMFSTLSDPG